MSIARVIEKATVLALGIIIGTIFAIALMYKHLEDTLTEGDPRFNHFEKECRLPLDSEMDIVLIREYRLGIKYNSLLPNHFLIKSDDYSFETFIKPTVRPFTVLGIKDGETVWDKHNLQGEPNKIRLPAAEQYTFIQNGKDYTIGYLEVCRDLNLK